MQGNNQKNTELGLVASFQRQIKSGNQFSKFFPKPDFSDTLLQEGNVDDTVHLMGNYIKKYISDTAKLAPLLKGKTLEQTLRNNWNFVYHHIQYKLDTPGIEELRRPARSWAERKSGVDCDCYTIFLCTLLLNQGIEPVIRIVQIPPATSFHHVYPIVYKSGKSGDYYTLDAVLDKFNYEKPFSKKRDYSMDELGIPIKGLHGIPENNKLSCLANTCDNNNLGSTDDPVYARLLATRDIIADYPASIAPFEDPQRFLEELNYAIKNWHTPNRDKALQVLAQREKQLDEIQPLNGLLDDVGDDLENMSAEQVDAMADLLSGGLYGLESVMNGEDLGRILSRKNKRLIEKEKQLIRNLKSTPKYQRNKAAQKLNNISRLRSRIKEIKSLSEQNKDKAARIIRQTYNLRPIAKNPKQKSKFQEERVDEPLRKSTNENILPKIYPGEYEDLTDQSYPYQEDFEEKTTYPVSEYSEASTDYYDFAQGDEISDNYQNDPYDEWLELIEDYLDDIEELEDEVALLELAELDGLAGANLGAFWHKRKKRLELKAKRQEKRLQKAEKKNKTGRAKQLKLKLEKNKKKLQDAGKWKKVRKQWRKDNKRGFWQGIQRTGKGAINALVKYNPLSIAARNGFLAALKINIKKISSRLKWGYATKQQALKHGMSMARWQKSKQALAKVENLFVNKTKGSKTALKNAILKGGKGLNGTEVNGLGAAQLAVVAAAATPLIIAVVKILQNSGIMDSSVSIKKVEEDIKNGKLENQADVPPSQFDEVQLEIEKSWLDKKQVKVAGAIGGGALLLGLGYYAFKANKKQPPAKKHQSNQLSGTTSGKPGTKAQRKKSPAKPKEEPIKEITLT